MGHMRTAPFSDERVSTTNQMLSKGVNRNEKEDTLNTISNETNKKRNLKLGIKLYQNIDNKIDNRQNKLLNDAAKFTTVRHASNITLTNDGASNDDNCLCNTIIRNLNANTPHVIANKIKRNRKLLTINNDLKYINEEEIYNKLIYIFYTYNYY